MEKIHDEQNINILSKDTIWEGEARETKSSKIFIGINFDFKNLVWKCHFSWLLSVLVPLNFISAVNAVFFFLKPPPTSSPA